jgi:hypothetical protein
VAVPHAAADASLHALAADRVPFAHDSPSFLLSLAPLGRHDSLSLTTSEVGFSGGASHTTSFVIHDSGSPDLLSSSDLATVARAHAVAVAMSPILRCGVDAPTVHDFVQIFTAAFAANDERLCSRHAQAWGNCFVFPNEAVDYQTSLLIKHGYNIASLLAELRVTTAPTRLSHQRIEQFVGTLGHRIRDPLDLARLHRLADGGVRITTHPNFTPLSTPPPLRGKYIETHHAIDRMLFDLYNKGQVLLFRTPHAMRVPGIHFSAQHWATKSGKPQGRAVSDLSNPDTPSHQTVNGTTTDEKIWVREQMVLEWGAIHLPSIDDIVLSILEVIDLCHGDSTQVVLWQIDLSGAYNLIDFHPESVQLMAFALMNDISVVYSTGLFGLTGMPYAFEVVSRVLEDIITAHIDSSGRLRMYVDDGCGVSIAIDAQAHLAIALHLIRLLLGDSAVNDEKVKMGRVLDMLGWSINLDEMTISASRRNLLKAIYVFFCIDTSIGVRLIDVQRLASMATRYSMVCRHMRPYTRALYAMQAMFHGRGHETRRGLSPAALSEIVMWRAFLCLLRFNEKAYARPLNSFRHQPPSYVIEYDASLQGLGVCVSRYTSPTESPQLMAYAAMSVPYTIVGSDSSYQNACEYTAVLLGLLILRALGVPSGFTYDLIGDSRSSLSWVARDGVRSSIAHNAHLGFTLVSVSLDATAASTHFIPSHSNAICDGLSRGLSGQQLGLPADLQFVLPCAHPVHRFISACDPVTELPSPEAHITFVQQLLAILNDT